MIIALTINSLDDNDRRLIEKIYHEYTGLMFYEAFKFYRANNQAEELVQKAWMKLIEHIETFKGLPKTKQAGYIGSIVRNTGIDEIRKNQFSKYTSFSDLPPEILESLSSDSFVEQEVLDYISLEELSNAIELLSPNYKYLMIAKYVLEKTDDEIADVLDINPSHVRIYLMRAKRKTLSIMEGMSHGI